MGWLGYLMVSFAVLFAIGPILWSFVTSMKPEGSIFVFPPTVELSAWSTENYRRVIEGTNILDYIANTVLVAAAAVGITLGVGVHAAYAVSRYELRGKEVLMTGLLLASMLPGVAVLVPLYLLSVGVGAYNTFWGMIIVYAGWRTPIVVWLLKGFVDRIPRDIEDAALVDGCSRMRTLYTIVLPLAQPGLAAAALVSFVFIWNDFLVGATFSTQEATRLIQVGLFQFVTEYGVAWGELTAALMLALVPIVAVFVALEPRFIAGLSSGAAKG